jgi:ketosteroid isomerase-like protein
MNKSIGIILAALVIWPAAPAMANAEEEAVGAVLNALHQRASAADFDGYFALYHPRAVFLGTDRDEYWPLAEFKRYTRARFANGEGWTYHPVERFVHVAGDSAWFEERLQHQRYGQTRGTGVLLKNGDRWRIVQYNLTLPIPNALFPEMAREISEYYEALPPGD